jgi:hypothetical protein
MLRSPIPSAPIPLARCRYYEVRDEESEGHSADARLSLLFCLFSGDGFGWVYGTTSVGGFLRELAILAYDFLVSLLYCTAFICLSQWLLTLARIPPRRSEMIS